MLQSKDESGLVLVLDTVPELMYINRSQNMITSYKKDSTECTKDSVAAIRLN